MTDVQSMMVIPTDDLVRACFAWSASLSETATLKIGSTTVLDFQGQKVIKLSDIGLFCNILLICHRLFTTTQEFWSLADELRMAIRKWTWLSPTTAEFYKWRILRTTLLRKSKERPDM
ncbi:hypothetical protein EON65_41625 [archaeon]|nr:MAG: hypothetical protein EON65_41625 [archaeon]